jgi:dCMP deaminase
MPLTHSTFLEISKIIAGRSTCTRGHVGAVIVQDRRIVSTGYNGAPPDMPHCMDVGCKVDKTLHHVRKITVPVDLRGDWELVPAELGCQRAIHAELNAIAWAARHGVATGGAILYATHGPCLKCAQAILAAGIVEVHFITPYRLSDGVDLLNKANIEVDIRSELER